MLFMYVNDFQEISKYSDNLMNVDLFQNNKKISNDWRGFQSISKDVYNDKNVF